MLEMSLIEHDSELLNYWFENLSCNLNTYKEPILEEPIVNFIKHFCDTLRQDSYIFIMTVDVLENYIKLKNQRNEEIADEVLVLASVVLLCNKFLGVSLELKIEHAEEFIYRITKIRYHRSSIISMEASIFQCFNGKLPTISILDDLNVVVTKISRELRLKADLQPACIRILEFLYISKKKWFEDLKEMYDQNDDCRLTFKSLICCKYFLPAGILLCVLQLTQYNNVLDIEKLTIDLTEVTKIHYDHLNILKNKIIGYIEN